MVFVNVLKSFPQSSFRKEVILVNKTCDNVVFAATDSQPDSTRPNSKLIENMVGRGLLQQLNDVVTFSLLAILDSTSLISKENTVQYFSV